MIPEIKAQMVKGEQPTHDNPHHAGRMSHLRRMAASETPEEVMMSQVFGVEMTQEQLDQQFRGRPKVEV